MELISNIILNMQAPAYATVYSPQGQTLARSIRAALMDGPTPWEIPSTALAVIRYIKPDGTVGFYDTLEDDSTAYTFTDNYITFGLAAQALTVPGTVLMQIDFYSADSEKLSTFTFQLVVSEGVFSDDVITSEDYINVLTGKIAEADEIWQQIHAAYGAPRVAATAAAMTDHSLIYVYTGSETGYTSGHWYYWDGSEWADGGVYNSAAVNTDKTLSVSNMPADAEACGKIISALSNNFVDVLRYGDEISSGGPSAGITYTRIKDQVYSFSGTISGSAMIRIYSNVNVLPSWLEKGKRYYAVLKGETANNRVYFEVLGFANGTTQRSFTGYCYHGITSFVIPADFVGGVYVRIGWLNTYRGTVVNETIEFHLYSEITSDFFATIGEPLRTVGTSYDSCDNVPPNRIVFVESNGGVKTIPDFPLTTSGTLITVGYSTHPIQYAIAYNNANVMKMRLKHSTWGSWHDIRPDKYFVCADLWGYSSCNDIVNNSCIFVQSSGGILSIPDAPMIGWLLTYYTAANVRYQIMYPYNTSNKILARQKNGSTWTSWRIVEGGGNTTTITQEISHDTYNNSYDITVNPSITTDSNGWLQPVDTNTEDETGKTDMTSAIMAMLNSTGYCHLAPGIYYVSGNIDMPANSMIEGCGKQTIIRLLQTTTSGYICRMHTRSTIKNVCFSGAYSPISIASSDIGGRIGIYYIGNRDGQSSGVTPSTTTCCMIEGCWFDNLDSGIYGYNAGGGLQEGMICNNCYIYRCKAGINIDYWTEYCKFTNIITFQCYFACINNGGNNVFTACTFHGVIGFVIDNSSGTKQNNAHGTVNGCTFNHIDNMNHPETLGNGYGIKLIDAVAGFVFSNCQFWYSKVYVEDSKGVQFSDCEFGGAPVIETSGSDTVFFDGCIFQVAPTKTLSSPVKFDNCYTYAGASVTA